MKRFNLILTFLFTISLVLKTFSQIDSTQIRINEIENSLNYKTGIIEFSNLNAKLNVPEGFRFLDSIQSVYVLSDLWGNPVDSTILGLLVPAERGVLATNSWVFTIKYSDIGYVKDDDAEDIDYDELLEQMQKETKEGNVEREKLGYEPIELVGWASQPYYDKKNKVLHWAKQLRFGQDSLETLNYNLRILGKNGMFVLNAVATMSELKDVKPNIDKVLTSVEFEKGSTYFDFNPELDKVAAWSIGGLVAGKVLAKVGILAFFAKFGKIIVMGLIPVGAAIWNFVRRRKKKESEQKKLS